MVSVEEFQDYCRYRYRATGKTYYHRYGFLYQFNSATILKHSISTQLIAVKRQITSETKSPVGVAGYMEALLEKQKWYLELWNFLMYGNEGWFVNEDNR